MQRLRRARKGFSILSIIMVLAIIGILSQNYMSTDTPTGEPWAAYQQSRTRSAVMAANLRTAETQFFMRTEGRQISLDQLRPILDDLSRTMGGGARYFVVGRDQRLHVTSGIQTERFQDMMDFPRER